MRKLCVWMLMALLLIVPALAEEADPAEAWFAEQAALLNPLGLEAAEQREMYDLALPDGTQAVSLCLTMEGDLRFGRYAQYVRTALMDRETGEMLSLDAVFNDLDDLQQFLDAYVEDSVLEELNTYLDANDLLPVPLDAVCLDELGVTFHYPAERFQFFSGHAGALQLQWYELRDDLAIDLPEQPFPLAEVDTIDVLLAEYGSLTDPDLVEGGEIYEFESPALRGIQAIADENGTVHAVRAFRFSVKGAEPGMSREEAEALLGAPLKSEALDADAARRLRLQEGEAAYYDGFIFYYDLTGSLYLAEAVRQ